MERIRIDRRHPRLRARRRASQAGLTAFPLDQPPCQRPPGGDDVGAALLDRIDAVLAEVAADPTVTPPT